MTDPLGEASLCVRTIAHLDVAAASGIVAQRDVLYVIADDRTELASYDHTGKRTGSIPLLPDTLPADPGARKREKPDFEALLELPDGSLLALGSGSTPRRMRGALIRNAANGPVVQAIDLSALYAHLLTELPELNIEGGTVWDDALYLASRGNGPHHDNALVRLDLDTLLGAHTLPAGSLRNIQRVALGALCGVPLGLTDLTVVDRRLVFSAAAEASDSTYADGACAGSVLGHLTRAGEVESRVVVSPVLKIEGVCARPGGLWLVADADDPQAFAPLMAADWPPP